MTTTSPEPFPDPDPGAVAPGSEGGGVLGLARREHARLLALPPGPQATLAQIMAYDAQRDAEEAQAQGCSFEADLDGEPVNARPASGGSASGGPGGIAAGATLDDLDAVLGGIADLESEVARLHGRRADLLARVHRLTDVIETDLLELGDSNVRLATTSRRRELAHRAVTAEVATMLRLGEHAAGTMTDHAITLTDKAPATLSALRQGRLSWAHATQLARQIADLDPREAREVEDAVLAQGLSCTPTQLAARARRARERVHPVPLDIRHAEARATRAVWLDAAHDGMACLSALLPATIATAAFDRLTRTAQAIRDHEKSQDRGRSQDQLRADVMAALLLDDGTLDHTPVTTPAGEPHADDEGRAAEDPLLALLCEQSSLTTLARSIRPRVNVTVPVMTLLGHTETPGTLDGHTPIDADTARRLAACAPSFHRLLTHPETGTVLSVGRSTYTVPADLKTYLEQRDLTCRFPGCRRPAHRSDADHTTDWANGGHTAAGNLAHLCRHHHIVKHQTRWRVRHVPDPAGLLDGTLEWTSPTGRTHITRPEQPDATLYTPARYPSTDADHRPVPTRPTGESDEELASTSSTDEGLVSTGEGLGDDPGPPPF